MRCSRLDEMEKWKNEDEDYVAKKKEGLIDWGIASGWT